MNQCLCVTELHMNHTPRRWGSVHLRSSLSLAPARRRVAEALHEDGGGRWSASVLTFAVTDNPGAVVNSAAWLCASPSAQCSTEPSSANNCKMNQIFPKSLNPRYGNKMALKTLLL